MTRPNVPANTARSTLPTRLLHVANTSRRLFTCRLFPLSLVTTRHPTACPKTDAPHFLGQA